MTMPSEPSEQAEPAASEVYEIEVFRVSFIRRWSSTLLGLIVAVVTMGGGDVSIGVYGNGYRIRERATGRVVKEIRPSMFYDGNTWTALNDDLESKSAPAFKERWF